VALVREEQRWEGRYPSGRRRHAHGGSSDDARQHAQIRAGPPLESAAHRAAGCRATGRRHVPRHGDGVHHRDDAAASIAPRYDFNAAAISDLGTIPETTSLFNGLLIVIGLFNIAAGSFLYRAYGSPWIVALFALAGLGSLGAGVVPLSAGDAHSLFALLAFLFFNLEAIAAARVVRGPLHWPGVVAGVIGLAYLGVMVIGDVGNPAVFGAIGHGGSERMIAYPVMLWMVAVGGYLLAQPDPGVGEPRRSG
jgi:hypothetical membrane protein